MLQGEDDVEPENDFWMHVVVFDRKLTE